MVRPLNSPTTDAEPDTPTAPVGIFDSTQGFNRWQFLDDLVVHLYGISAAGMEDWDDWDERGRA